MIRSLETSREPIFVEQKRPENFDYLRSETLEICIRKRHHLVHAIICK